MASILLRMEEGQREAIRAAALKAGVKMAPWALGELLKAASGLPATPDPSARLQAARTALHAGEHTAAPLGKPVSLDAVAPRCSKHKLPLPCRRCDP